MDVVIVVVFHVHIMVPLHIILTLISARLLVNELFEHWDHLRRFRILIIARHHLRRKERNDLRISHLLIVVRVNLVEKWLDFALVFEDAHREDQVLELIFVEQTIAVQVKALKVQVELFEEALVLLQLEVEDDLLEVAVHVLLHLLVAVHDSLVHFFARHLALHLRVRLLLLLGSVLDDFADLSLQGARILVLVHFVQNLEPDPILNLAVLSLLEVFLNVGLRLERVLVLVNHPDELQKSVLYMQLDESEFFVALIFQDLGEKCHLMIFTKVGFHRVDYAGSPLNNE